VALTPALWQRIVEIETGLPKPPPGQRPFAICTPMIAVLPSWLRGNEAVSWDRWPPWLRRSSRRWFTAPIFICYAAVVSADVRSGVHCGLKSDITPCQRTTPPSVKAGSHDVATS